MKKHFSTILIILLALSLGINIFLGISVYKHKQYEAQMTAGVCYEIADKCASAIFYINRAVSPDSQHPREDAHSAGSILKNLSAILSSGAIDPQIAKYVSFSTMGSLLCDDVSGIGHTAIGSLTEETPFSAEEVRFLQSLSEALEKVYQTFTELPVSDANTEAFRESIKTPDHHTINQALKVFYDTAETLWESAANAGK